MVQNIQYPISLSNFQENYHDNTEKENFWQRVQLLQRYIYFSLLCSLYFTVNNRHFARLLDVSIMDENYMQAKE
jgi:hypothetical protein